MFQISLYHVPHILQPTICIKNSHLLLNNIVCRPRIKDNLYSSENRVKTAMREAVYYLTGAVKHSNVGQGFSLLADKDNRGITKKQTK